jgi:uncharacterized membrane protein YfcA
LHTLVARYGSLAAVAFLAGTLNAVAGGGSFLSFPALLGVSLPPVNANATNTVALWPGQLSAIIGFRRELTASKGLVIPTICCALVGGIAGAETLLHTDQRTFLALVPWLLFFGTVLFALSGLARQTLDRLRMRRTAGPRRHVSFTLLFWLSLVCFYIGYFGAGAGFLIVSVLSVFSGLSSIHEMNALKVVANTTANGIAVITFIAAHAIFWREGLLMMFFAAAGGYFGAAYSRKLDPGYVRAFVIIGGFAISAYFFVKVYW